MLFGTILVCYTLKQCERMSPRPLQNTQPLASHKRLEGEEALQSELSVFRILHPCCGRTPQDLSFSSGILATTCLG